MTRSLLAANGLAWLLLGVATGILDGSTLAGPEPGFAIMMFGNALFLLVLAWRMTGESRPLLGAAAGWVGINLILSLTDQLGTLDVAVALLNAATLLAIAAVWMRGRG